MKKILLIGIGGVYNYGCEAIVRGTVNLLCEAYPGVEIFYASSRPQDDAGRLDGCSLHIMPRCMRSQYSPKRLFWRFAKKTGIPFYPCIDVPEQADGMDAVFSIGGDIFTLNSNGNLDTLLFRFGEEVQRRGVPYILWGASIGPFSVNPAAEKRIAAHLRGVKQIFAREELTVGYLHSLGIAKNVKFFPDPAFYVAPEIIKVRQNSNGKPRIAINLSPLSSRHFDMDIEKIAVQQAKAIDGLITNFNADVVLIPHVIANFDESDDDLRYLKRVASHIVCKDRVRLIDSDPGFIGIKKELIKCDLLIAARMHCAINGLCSLVPTIFLAYSIKARGMCRFVYGDEEFVADLNEFDNPRFKSIVDRIIKKNSEVSVFLSNKLQDIRERLLVPWNI